METFKQARLIDLLNHECTLNPNKRGELFEELAKYQQADGGFSRLEGDVLNPHSSPIATSIALYYMVKHQINTDHEMVKNVLDYLSHTPHMTNGIYHATLESNNDYPCAVWWNHDEKSNQTFGYNPSVVIYAYVLCLSDPRDAFYTLTQARLVQAIRDYLKQDTPDFHLLLNHVEAYEVARHHLVDDLFLNAYKAKITLDLDYAIQTDKDQWGISYCFLPTDAISSPHHVFYPQFKDDVHACLDVFYTHLLANKGFEIPWQWYQYLEAFQKQKPLLDAAYTLKWLTLFHTFNKN